jgi:hypothetical protein
MTLIPKTPTYQSFLKELEGLNPEPESVRELFHSVINKYYDKIKRTDYSKYLFLEHEMFHIRKSVSGGFSPQSTSIKKAEGVEIEVIWPDYNQYDEDSFQYYKDRFHKSNNVFLKPQYGLMCYIHGNLRDNRDKMSLVESLIIRRILLFIIPRAELKPLQFILLFRLFEKCD